MVQVELDDRTYTRTRKRRPYYGEPFPEQYKDWLNPTQIGNRVETPEPLRNFLPVGKKFFTLGPRDVLRLLARYQVLEYQSMAPPGTLPWVPKGKLADGGEENYAIFEQCVGYHKTDGSPVLKEVILFSPRYAQMIVDYWTKKTDPLELTRRLIQSWPGKYRKRDMDQFLSEEDAELLWNMVKAKKDPITEVPDGDKDDDDEEETASS
jgi:hypothetical protein